MPPSLHSQNALQRWAEELSIEVTVLQYESLEMWELQGRWQQRDVRVSRGGYRFALRLHLLSDLPADLRICRGGVLASLTEGPEVRLGLPDLDTPLHIQTAHPEPVRRLLEPRRGRQSLLRFFERYPDSYLGDHALTLVAPTAMNDGDRLAALLQELLAVAQDVDANETLWRRTLYPDRAQ